MSGHDKTIDATLDNHVRVSIATDVTRSYKEVITGEKNIERGITMKPTAEPRREGGNIIVQLDIEDYIRGVQDLQFSVVGR